MDNETSSRMPINLKKEEEQKETQHSAAFTKTKVFDTDHRRINIRKDD